MQPYVFPSTLESEFVGGCHEGPKAEAPGIATASYVDPPPITSASERRFKELRYKFFFKAAVARERAVAERAERRAAYAERAAAQRAAEGGAYVERVTAAHLHKIEKIRAEALRGRGKRGRKKRKLRAVGA
ncbi:hypothetical protein EMIHUDRAFT_225859 [Emiliania huxleyi CCMP1516]|uniref:Uncharacterized protein n=2 Tax=Emiliania huxleyi TaxID=2903 RepID=A0A0D3KN24_EMIH1|nr:hypothetical protein EMIHUDRAFT_225859 [Emiliania huxleyi CCMP1516]EOD37159.1 hypothetical protein EMIHUDRAFT_225859 [Emiliania huxleyi CCMP1516]|eukprot:XP_005789588.1 hypothetical protein EMIHUDRAFT_225859 [Emiliania huxleyi CCMP1516]